MAQTQGIVTGTRAGFRKPAVSGWLLLLAPVLLFLAAAFVYPLIFVVQRSLPGMSPRYYGLIISSPVYFHVIWLTFQTSGLVTLVCLLLAYPYALAMARAGGRLLAMLSIVLLLPFWVSLLLRTFAWMVLLQDTGLVNTILLDLGVIDQPLELIRNSFGVTVGMTHILLPYMVLPIYSVMRQIDPKLMEAATICGASPRRAFLRVFLPLSIPGVYAGALLVFTLALGFYITPALLGGPKNTMIAQLIAAQVNEQLNFSFGSALAVVLLVLTGIAFGLFGVLRKLKGSGVRLPGAQP
jgi:ABC-type spermidine/putrescine transport system permease subunit I